MKPCIGDKIIETVGGLFKVHDSSGRPLQAPCIFVWSSGASEQLEAVVESYIEERVQHDRDLILGALDSMGVALTKYNHHWSTGERSIYEESCKLLGRPENDPV